MRKTLTIQWEKMYDKVNEFKILLVEDNPGDVRLVEIFLGESDLRDSVIINEKTLSGAIEALNKTPFDVVLLDFNLLDSNGFDTLQNLFEAHPKANVIVFTGMEDNSLGIRALQAGAQDYLVKGNFGSDFLAKTLRYAIERNRSSQRLEEAEREANKSKERYERIFSLSKDAIYITKENGKFVEFNEATSKLFGYTEEELKDIDAGVLYESAEERKSVIDAINENTFVQDHPINICTQDGAVRHCLITANLVDEEGEKEYHGIIRDITEQREADELRKQNEIAEERDQLRGQLLTTVSHEMRTPMNAIMGLVDLLLKDDLSEEQLSYLTSVKSSSEHLLRMINDILELQKIHFDIKLEEGSFDLHDTLMNLINIQYSTVKDVSIAINIDKNVPRFIVGDQKRLNQILINLVSNAFKFTEKGEVIIRVKTLEQEEDNVKLGFEVEDTGIGMPADKLESIFDPFVRVRDTNKKFYPGIGLGLSIVNKIVKLMKGEISVTSELDKGSTFSFYILTQVTSGGKIKPPSPKPHPIPPKPDPVTNGRTTHPTNSEDKIHILLAEDNLMNQLVTKKQLERDGVFELTIAENGQIATQIVQQKDFKIVLMDIQMPIMDGYEATEHMRNVLNIPPKKLPILAMTAHADVVDDEKYKDSGMQDCIVKPVSNWQEVIEKIKNYIDAGEDLYSEKKSSHILVTEP